MKKILSLLIMLSMLSVLFVGCGETELTDSQVSSLLKSAFKKTESLENLTAKNYSEVSYDFGSYVYSSRTENSIREANIGNPEKYEMSSDVVVKSLGAETTYETYY